MKENAQQFDLNWFQLPAHAGMESHIKERWNQVDVVYCLCSDL